MNFSIFKNLFKKKTKENINITTIDTNNIHIRTFSMLDKNEKKKVLEYLNKLDYTNYKELVKYTDDISNLYSFEQEILNQTMDRYKEKFECNINITMVYTKLAKYEYSYIINNIWKIRKELECRLLALEMFLKKKEFNKVFGSKKDKTDYLVNKDNIKSEISRIKISIKTVDYVLGMVAQNIKENSNIEEKIKELESVATEKIKNDIKRCFGSELDMIVEYCLNHFDLTESFAFEVNEKLLDKVKREKESLLKRTISKKIRDSLEIEILQLDSLWYYIKGPHSCSWSSLPQQLSDKDLEELYKITAKYLHQYEINYCNHKNDYKIYLEDMNNIINTYMTTPTAKWDMASLEEKIMYYLEELDSYLDMFEDYIGLELRDKLWDTFNKMVWLYYLKEDKYIYDYDYKTMYDFSNELLTKVEDKFGVKLDIGHYHTKEKKYIERNNFINNYWDTHFIDFIDLLNDNYDNIDIAIYSKELQEDNHLINIEYFLKQIGIKNIDSFYHFISQTKEDKKLTLEEIFYLLKLLKKDKFDLTKTNQLSTVSSIDLVDELDFAKYLALVMFKIYENNYDDRILIIPDIVYNFLGVESREKYFYQQVSVGKEAVFARDREMFKDFLISEKNRNCFKYLFVKEDVINSFRDWIKWVIPILHKFSKNSRQELCPQVDMYKKYLNTSDKEIMINDFKIIIIPNDTTYKDLTNYLDIQLEKDKILQKKLG